MVIIRTRSITQQYFVWKAIGFDSVDVDTVSQCKLLLVHETLHFKKAYTKGQGIHNAHHAAYSYYAAGAFRDKAF